MIPVLFGPVSSLSSLVSARGQKRLFSLILWDDLSCETSIAFVYVYRSSRVCAHVTRVLIFAILPFFHSANARIRLRSSRRNVEFRLKLIFTPPCKRPVNKFFIFPEMDMKEEQIIGQSSSILFATSAESKLLKPLLNLLCNYKNRECHNKKKIY